MESQRTNPGGRIAPTWVFAIKVLFINTTVWQVNHSDLLNSQAATLALNYMLKLTQNERLFVCYSECTRYVDRRTRQRERMT